MSTNSTHNVRGTRDGTQRLWEVASEVAKELSGIADVIMIEGGFLVREVKNDSTPQDAPTQTQVVQEQVVETPHYPPQFIQSPQNQFAQLSLQMALAMFQQNPMLALSMMQGQHTPYVQYPQHSQAAYAPTVPAAYVPTVPTAPTVSTAQTAPTASTDPVPTVPAVPSVPTTSVDTVVKKSERKEKTASTLATSTVQSAPKLATPTVSTVSTASTVPTASTAENSKGRWATVAAVGARSDTKVRGVIRREAKANKTGVEGVTFPDTVAQELPPGYVSGDMLKRNRGKNAMIPICTVKHTREECTGEHPWVQCMGYTIEVKDGVEEIVKKKINDGTCPLAYAAAHSNDVGKNRPTTSDFCRNSGGNRKPDIHGCQDPDCTANHVVEWIDKEELNAKRAALRTEKAKSRPRPVGNGDKRPRSRAVGANGEHPGDITVGDFDIMVKEGVTINLADSQMNISTGSADNIPVGETAGAEVARPVIMKKSIEGVPANLSGKIGGAKE